MNKSKLVIGILMLAIGVGVGYLLPNSGTEQSNTTGQDKKPLFYRNAMNPAVTSPVPTKDSMGMDYVPVYADSEKKSAKREVLFYRNPMNPDVTSPIPAKDAMGMDYIAVYADNDQSDVSGMVKIDPVVVQNIGVRTALAKRTELGRTIRAVGLVSFNEERMVRIHPKVEGWIEDIRVDKTGEKVDKGDVLLSVYSPKLVSTQQEYLLALSNLSALEKSPFEQIRTGAKELVKSSRERLEFLDVPEHQIRALERTKKIKKSLHIHSPATGTVIKIGARQGQFITPKTEIYMLVDLSEVWVYADIYEYELPWVNLEDKVEMTLASVPGATFTGSVAYIYPYAEAKTRTTKVRMVFKNDARLLRPDMFAEVSIKAAVQKNAIVIPAEAVVRSGAKAQVFVVRGPGKFEPRVVKLGVESDGKVIILKGIKAGDEVVTSAQFLVDSESKLREATSKMLDSIKAKASNKNDTKDDSITKQGDMND